MTQITAGMQFVSILQSLPERDTFDELLEKAAEDFVAWLDGLEAHLDDTRLRKKYLEFVQTLPRNEKCDAWRRKAADSTAAWLSMHDEDTQVRILICVIQSGTHSGNQKGQSLGDSNGNVRCLRPRFASLRR